MIKYYDVGGYKFRLEELPTGYYKLTTKEGEFITQNLFLNLNQVYKEIVSYSETDEDDWES